MNSRAVASYVLLKVLQEKQSLATVLPAQLAAHTSLRDPQLVQAICYGVLRHYFELEFTLSQLLSKPLKSKDADLMYLLLIGLYQLRYLSVPAPVALNETVNAAKHLGKSWATGLINGVLRHYLREQKAKPFEAEVECCKRFNHPLWLIEHIKKFWPNHWEAILTANQTHPPMTLRINERLITREKYQTLLEEKEIKSEICQAVNSALTLESPVRVQQLPFFNEGYLSIQDAASQLVAYLIDIPPHARVLDACAAPGGKTCHILERAPDIQELVALDIDEERTTKIKENLARLNLQATVKIGDATQPKTWWDEQQFDRILCDAPCSATGVIRRHPDIKFLRQPSDIASLQQQQLSILRALWPLLKNDGKLLYSTCSIFPEENVEVIQQFLAEEPTAQWVPFSLSFGHAQSIGLQILPGEMSMDGFYYVLLGKK